MTPKVAQEGLKESVVPVHLAKKNCPRCFGRGIVGRYASGGVAPCRCVAVASAERLRRPKPAP